MEIDTPPYLGAAYYPEAWDEKEVDEDIRRMKDMGVNVVRVGEFAWTFMEPEEGKYDFGWLHRAVEKLGDSGIAVVMCTPTATPPAWLIKKHSDIAAVMPTGQRLTHGGRRHACPNSTVYREYCRLITEKLAKEFAGYSSIVAWQLDNELGSHINTCHCDQCERDFRQFLKDIYGSIDNLNRSWGTAIWSVRFNNFREIPLPIPSMSPRHPSLEFYFKYFMSRSYSNYAKEQAVIIRKYSSVPITTNGMRPPAHYLDYEDLFSNLDFASIDNYFAPSEMHKMCSLFDWMRPFCQKPYWFMETSSTYPGGLTAGPGRAFIHNPGAMRAKCWLSYALGGEAVLFWLWRAHWSGQEMEHGSLTYAWGEPTLSDGEFRQLSGDLTKAKAFLNETKPESPEVAIHFSYPAQWAFDIGSLAEGFDYVQAFYEYHRLLLEANIPRDIIFPHADLSRYKVIASPYMAIIPDETIERMKKHVENGNVWILGPMAGFRTEHCTAFKDGAYGPLEELIGAHVRHRFPAAAEGGKIDFEGCEDVKCTGWCDAFLPKQGTTAIATYADGPAKGMAAGIERPLGKGKIITLGTQFNRGHLSKWLISTMKNLISSEDFDASAGIVVVKRVGSDNKPQGIIVVDISGEGGKIIVKKQGIDLLSDRELVGKVDISAYGVMVLKFL